MTGQAGRKTGVEGAWQGAVAGSEKRPGPRGEFSSPVSGVAASALCLAGSQNFPQGVGGSWDPSKPLAARPDRCHGNSVARRRARGGLGSAPRPGGGAGSVFTGFRGFPLGRRHLAIAL